MFSEDGRRTIFIVVAAAYLLANKNSQCSILDWCCWIPTEARIFTLVSVHIPHPTIGFCNVAQRWRERGREREKEREGERGRKREKKRERKR